MSDTRNFLTFFFFNDTATTEIYTLSLHDALPISPQTPGSAPPRLASTGVPQAIASSADSPKPSARLGTTDRKSTRLNSSHANISYAVFCLKKKKSSHPS